MRRSSFRHVTATAVACAVAASAALAGSSPASRVTSLTVDGDLSDWLEAQAQTSETEPKLTAVAQDGTFLYAYFIVADLDLARRVLRSGAIVWVNSGGKHEEGYGLRFRGTEAMQKAFDEAEKTAKATATPAAATTGEQAATARGRGRQGGAARAPLGTLEVLRGGTVNELINAGSRENGPAAACTFADGTGVYEFRIPLAEIGLPAAGDGAGAERAIAVGFQMSGRTQADRQAARNRQRTSRGTVPSPWTDAPAGGGEAQPDAAGGSGQTPSDAAAAAAGTQAEAGAPATAAARRPSYPTIWHDIAVTPPAPPAAAE